MNKQQLTVFAGHALECFDNTLYGFFAVMLAPIYFPTSGSEYIALLGSYGAFAAGFLSRPLGALFFGLVGDRSGRKNPLVWSMAFVGIPTATIGLLPGYATLGIISPIILITCRLLQGFFYGGEFTGVNLNISENDNHNNDIGKRTGILMAIGCVGAVLGTLMGAFFSMEVMPSWSWRVPFIFGGISAVAIYFFRRNLQETSDFVELQHNNETLKNPWRILFISHKFSLILSIFIAGLTMVPLYSATIFGNQIFKELGYSTSQSLLLNTFDMFLCIIVVPLFGRLADKIGFQNHMQLATCLTVIVPIPAFLLISGTIVSTLNVLVFVSSVTISGVVIMGCAVPYVAQLFPTNCRYSAVAVSLTLGFALIGGTTPLVSAYLRSKFHSNLAPAFWICLISSITMIGVYLAGKKYQQQLKVANNCNESAFVTI